MPLRSAQLLLRKWQLVPRAEVSVFCAGRACIAVWTIHFAQRCSRADSFQSEQDQNYVLKSLLNGEPPHRLRLTFCRRKRTTPQIASPRPSTSSSLRTRQPYPSALNQGVTIGNSKVVPTSHGTRMSAVSPMHGKIILRSSAQAELSKQLRILLLVMTATM